MLFEPFHYASYVLRAFAGTDEKCVGGFHDNQIRNSYSGDELRRTPDEISRGIESKHASAGNILSSAFGQEFVNSSPGTDIAPVDGCGNDEDATFFGIARRRFEQGVIDGNIFQAGIFASE